MGSKRAADGDTIMQISKRHKGARTDQTSSQRGAFGDLENTTTAPAGDGDFDCEDDSEALEYLRSVRIQASAIPHVLVAKKAGPTLPPPASGFPDSHQSKSEDGEDEDVDRTLYQNGVGDFRGYYQDGAYMAYPEGHWDEDEEDEEYHNGDLHESGQDRAQVADNNELYGSDSAEDGPYNSSADEIRDAYFSSITNQYIALRKLLQTSPPDSALLALPSTNLTEVGEWKRGVDTFQKWESRLRGTDPLPAQIAGMHKDSVLRLLRIIITSKFLRKSCELRERTSRWIWALLARLPDKGELDYKEIGWIRELGKRAVLMMVSLAELEVLREHYDVAGSSPGEHDEYEAEVDIEEYFDDEFDQDIPVDDNNLTSTSIKEEHMDNPFAASSSATSHHGHQPPHDFAHADYHAANTVRNRSHPDDFSDVEMQLDSDMEDGEVADVPPSPLRSDPITDIETARARLLAQLSNDKNCDGEAKDRDLSATLSSEAPVAQLPSLNQPATIEGHASSAAADKPAEDGVTIGQERQEHDAEGEMKERDERDHKHQQELDRAKVNERATLNMILTVVGEFYGQRDLLEFRDPFGGLQLE
ncbi:hypothetical protein F5Y19DRAFT_452226 [Xylariaceae sp. FL1651]|nr:hypothetical protein F5Y19DRAFT_452226 [Xylariaceae sp. FL1651]